jgi:hypothetical protein
MAITITTNLPATKPPTTPLPIRIADIKAFRVGLDTAKPGQTLLYYEGDLMYDRAYNTKLTKSDKSKLNALAGAVYEAYEVGRVLLTQKRVGPHVWAYQAVIRR